MIEDADDAGLAANPDLAAEILRRHRIIRLVELDVAVAMHLAPRLGEARKQRIGQRRERGALGREERADLLAHGAVYPGVGDATFPVGEEQVLPGERGERAAFERVVLRVLYPGFDLPLVLGRAGCVGKTTVP